MGAWPGLYHFEVSNSLAMELFSSRRWKLDRPKQKAVVFVLNPENYATHAWHDSIVVGRSTFSSPSTKELHGLAIFDILPQVDTTAIIAAFFPEVEYLMANLFRGGRKKTNDIIISWCQEILDKRRQMVKNPGGNHIFADFSNCPICESCLCPMVSGEAEYCVSTDDDFWDQWPIL